MIEYYGKNFFFKIDLFLKYESKSNKMVNVCV